MLFRSEIQLTDSMIRLMGSQTFTSLQFEGRSYDCGSKIGFIAANIAFGLEQSDISGELMTIMSDLTRAKAAE